MQRSLAQIRDAEVRQFEAHIKYLERTCELLLNTYRALNRAARSTPSPAYFDQRFTFASSLEADLAGLWGEKSNGGDPGPLSLSLEQLQNARAAVLSAHDAAFAAFTNVGDVTGDAKGTAASA